MMTLNWLAVAVTALVPLVVGAIYYHPKIAGNAWMKASGMTQEMIEGGNMAKILGLTFLMSLMLTFALMPIVIHQMSVFSLFAHDPSAMEPGTELNSYLNDFMAKYGDNFRTFKHGAFHGFLTSVLLALPILGIGSLFERRSGKYIFIHWGYWAVTLTVMGAILCGWS